MSSLEPFLEVQVGVHEVQVDSVVSPGQDPVQVGLLVAVQDGLPLRVPVADLVVALPVRILAFQPLGRAGIGRSVAPAVPLPLPVVPVAFGLADAQVKLLLTKPAWSRRVQLRP